MPTISQLTPTDNLDGSEYLALVQNGVTRRISLAQIVELVAGSIGPITPSASIVTFSDGSTATASDGATITLSS